jgi:hypothetical protein
LTYLISTNRQQRSSTYFTCVNGKTNEIT